MYGGRGWREDWWHNQGQGWHHKDGWGENQWGRGSVWGNGGSEKYSNVSTLGLKHPMPLEDRKELVLGLLTRLQEEVVEASAASTPGSVAGNFRIAVASWGVVLVHAVLFYLCRAKPSMPVRTLFNEERKFIMADAVKMLWGEHTSLFPTAEDKAAALQLLSECRFGDAKPLLEQAKQLGFDPGEVEGKAAASVPGSVAQTALANAAVRGNVAPAASLPSSSRALQRMTTDEELAHLKKRGEVLQLRKSLAEEEARLRSSPQVSGQSDVRVPDKPEVSQRHESVMREALPSGILEPVKLRSTEAPSTSGGPASGSAPSGSSVSGALSLPPGSEGSQVRVQALVQGAWSASMAMLQGKSPEQTELLKMKQWLDEMAAAAKAEATPAEVAAKSQARVAEPPAKVAAKPEASPAGVAAKAGHGQASASVAQTTLEKMKAALLAMKLQVQQEEALMEQEALAEQPALASINKESHIAGGGASSSATGTGDGKCLQASGSLATGTGIGECSQASKALREEIAKMEAQRAELREKEQSAETREKEQAEKMRALQCEVEALRGKEIQGKSFEAQMKELAQAEESRQRELQAELKEKAQAEEMRQAEQLQALQAEVQSLRDSREKGKEEQEMAHRLRSEQEQQEQEQVQRLREEAIALRQQLEVHEKEKGESEQDEDDEDADRKRPRIA